MKFFKKLLSVSLAAAVIFSVISLINVSAQDATINSQQITRIQENCTLAKNTLNQLHASDALLRVNMGQLYESISTKLMDKFNNRVSNNDFNNTGLVSVINSYNSTLDIFRSDYRTYEEHLSSAINIDCKNQPVSFYDAVYSARIDRDRVHDDIVKLNRYIGQYQSAVNQFEKDYINSTNGVNR